MVRIEVFLYKKYFHWSSHIEAIVTDLSSIPERSFYINYPDMGEKNNHQENVRIATARTYRTVLGIVYSEPPIVLYSQKDFNRFKINFYHKFANEEQYSVLFKNCADAVGYTLDYFFSNHREKETLDSLYSIYQGVCCGLSMVTFASILLPTPPGISSPQDVYNRAKLFACISKNNTALVKKDQGKSFSNLDCENKEWRVCSKTKEEVDLNTLFLAIWNNEADVINHFLTQHKHHLSSKHICYIFLCFLLHNKIDSAKSIIDHFPDWFSVINEKQCIYSYKPKQQLSDEELKRLFDNFISQSFMDHSFVEYCGNVLSPAFIIQYFLLDNSWKFFGPHRFSYVDMLKKHIGKFTIEQIDAMLNILINRNDYDLIDFIFDHRKEVFQKPVSKLKSCGLQTNSIMKNPFSSIVLGRYLRDFISSKQYRLAIKLLDMRPDVYKGSEIFEREKKSFFSRFFSVISQNKCVSSVPGLQHILINSGDAELELFKKLCEYEPGIDLSLRYNKKNALDLSVEYKLDNHVEYIIKNHSKKFTVDEINHAKEYLLTPRAVCVSNFKKVS